MYLGFDVIVKGVSTCTTGMSYQGPSSVGIHSAVTHNPDETISFRPL